MILFSRIREFYHDSAITLPAMQKFASGSIVLSVDQRKRRGLAVVFICVIFSAMAVYVWAVNAMLFDGEAIQKGNAVFAALEREHSALESILAERQSPSWLEDAARVNGMVEVAEVRYLKSAQSVALLR